MNNSWHFNYYKDKSVINELLELVNEDVCMEVITEYGQFKITKETSVSIGAGAMMIAEDNKVSFINTDKIIYIQLIGANDKHYNKTPLRC